MNYIGSKLSLLSFLEDSIQEITGNNFTIFCDLFAGTSAVGVHYKKKGFKIISNDIQYYSYALGRHYIGNSVKCDFSNLMDTIGASATDIFNNNYTNACQFLNALPGIEGFIYSNYTPGGTANTEYIRKYFTNENGKRCDHIRSTIEDWSNKGIISEDEYFYLLATLLEAIDKFANTASVYGAFLKSFKKTALRPLHIDTIPLYESEHVNEMYNEDINEVIKQISGDVLYLDPPYNHRQYATNYHLLETIARYDSPEIYGVTGLRSYEKEKSLYCMKNAVYKQFSKLIEDANFKYIFLSYNNEGILTLDEIKDIMEKHGKYGCFTQRYARFKADTDENRNHKADHTVEYLHYLIK